MNESELIEKINKQFNALYDIQFEHNRRSLKHEAKEILNSIIELQNITSNQVLLNACNNAIMGLDYTIEKDVQWVENAYKAFKQKNAAQKRRTEFFEKFDTAIRHIDADICSIIKFGKDM